MSIGTFSVAVVGLILVVPSIVLANWFFVYPLLLFAAPGILLCGSIGFGSMFPIGVISMGFFALYGAVLTGVTEPPARLVLCTATGFGHAL